MGKKRLDDQPPFGGWTVRSGLPPAPEVRIEEGAWAFVPPRDLDEVRPLRRSLEALRVPLAEH